MLRRDHLHNTPWPEPSKGLKIMNQTTPKLMASFCSLLELRTPTPSPTYTRVFQRSPANLPWAYHFQSSLHINLITHPITAAGNMLTREMPEDVTVKVKRPVETTLVLNKGSLVVFDMSSICAFPSSILSTTPSFRISLSTHVYSHSPQPAHIPLTRQIRPLTMVWHRGARHWHVRQRPAGLHWSQI